MTTDATAQGAPRTEAPSQAEELAMRLASSDNPRSRQHDEKNGKNRRMWRCVPISDIVHMREAWIEKAEAATPVEQTTFWLLEREHALGPTVYYAEPPSGWVSDWQKAKRFNTRRDAYALADAHHMPGVIAAEHALIDDAVVEAARAEAATPVEPVDGGVLTILRELRDAAQSFGLRPTIYSERESRLNRAIGAADAVLERSTPVEPVDAGALAQALRRVVARPCEPEKQPNHDLCRNHPGVFPVGEGGWTFNTNECDWLAMARAALASQPATPPQPEPHS